MRKVIRDAYLLFTGRLKTPEPGIHIINSHYVTPKKVHMERDIKIFGDFLLKLSTHCRFITLEEAKKKINTGDYPKHDVYIAFTFDDGFEECHSVIAAILEKYGTRGTFFINANYIDSSLEYQDAFHHRINTFTKQPMSWAQVINLHERGHLIGSHGLDHFDFGELSDDEIEYQVTENKRILESKLNYQCEHFAWTYGQFKHFPLNALHIVKKYHKYIYSATNYQQYMSFDGEVINRRHLESFWPKSHINYFLSIEKK